MGRIFASVIVHLWKEHWGKTKRGKDKKSWIKCWTCWFYYLLGCFFILLYTISANKNKKYRYMNEILQWVLIIAIISIPPVFVALINYYAEKKKKAAETEKIKLENKITKEITYGQLKEKSKHESIKNKIQVFQELVELEGKLKSSGRLTAGEQKKLEALEMLKKEFKTSFIEPEKKPLAETTKKLLINKKGSKLPKNKKRKK